MKQLLILLLCAVSLSLQAQGITEQNLAGNWKICAFDINGIYWDFKSDTVKLPAEYEGTLGQSQKEAMIADIRSGLADYKEGTIVFKGNYIEQSMEGKVASGTYTIEKKNGLDYLKVVNDDPEKTVDMLQVTLKDGAMHMSLPDDMGGTTVLIYCR